MGLPKGTGLKSSQRAVGYTCNIMPRFYFWVLCQDMKISRVIIPSVIINTIVCWLLYSLTGNMGCFSFFVLRNKSVMNFKVYIIGYLSFHWSLFFPFINSLLLLNKESTQVSNILSIFVDISLSQNKDNFDIYLGTIILNYVSWHSEVYILPRKYI